MATIRDLARQMSEAFISDKRNDGSEFRKLRDGSPEWMTEVVRAAHRTGSGTWDVMMPDDHRYEFVEAACDAIAECESDDPSEAVESIEADIYTHDLTRWLHSRADRYTYCDQYVGEYGISAYPGIIELLQGGQRAEREEVFGLVLDALRDLADDDSEDETTDAA